MSEKTSQRQAPLTASRELRADSRYADGKKVPLGHAASASIQQKKRSRGAVIGVLLLAGLASLGTGWLAVSLQDSKRETVQLEGENARLAQQLEGLLQEVSGLKKQLDSSYAAVDVGGSVDFPVQRGMARAGDTVETFARREGTTVEVVRALNPRLSSAAAALANRETVWLPKTRVVREQ